MIRGSPAANRLSGPEVSASALIGSAYFFQSTPVRRIGQHVVEPGPAERIIGQGVAR